MDNVYLYPHGNMAKYRRISNQKKKKLFNLIKMFFTKIHEMVILFIYGWHIYYQIFYIHAVSLRIVIK